MTASKTKKEIYNHLFVQTVKTVNKQANQWKSMLCGLD